MHDDDAIPGGVHVGGHGTESLTQESLRAVAPYRVADALRCDDAQACACRVRANAHKKLKQRRARALRGGFLDREKFGSLSDALIATKPHAHLNDRVAISDTCEVGSAKASFEPSTIAFVSFRALATSASAEGSARHERQEAAITSGKRREPNELDPCGVGWR